MGLVLTTVNMKGGVGKTTLTVNLATCLAKYYKKRVLVIDLDSQISATLSLIAPQEFAKLRKGRKTLSYLIDKVIQPYIKRKFSTEDLIFQGIGNIEGMDLLPGDIELYDEYIVSETLHKQSIADGNLNFSQVWREFEDLLINSIIEPIIDDYDFILMDCAPGYNLLTRSGIAASDFYLLPARPEPLSLVGIQLLERRIAKLKKNHDLEDRLNLLGIVFILSGGVFSGRYYQQVIQRVEQDFDISNIFSNRIPMDVNVAKAVDTFTPAVMATPNSPGAKAFIHLTKEFLEKIEKAKA
ncbi:ParA family protein [Lusitaniella coriacea LEGE 07157]|uniref:ParA family protein n=1 Tax=Lusitaniella coriacea LEGE 07157 TaxID=945747 RepID=A0A8J7J2R0_9CYAN|nr:ParA family protein [Lusitaniella coriacea]MBE9116509.1 ParA family protein [Lusitaniella coriacea LEGE 07157]